MEVGRGRRIPDFRIDETTLDDGTRTVAVHGELDLATAPALGQRIRRPIFWEGTERVIVDLSGVVFLDSSGASALLLSLGHAAALDRKLVFVCPPGVALRRLQIYGLDSRLELFSTAAEAEAALAGPQA
jgi:anti-anti-sigma factor